MKKALALLLVVVLALGMSTTAFATVTKSPMQAAPDWTGKGGDLGEIIADKDISVFFDLLQADFGTTGWDATYEYSSGGVVKTDITKSKLTLRTKIAKGSVAIDEVKFDYSGTAIAPNTGNGTLKTAKVEIAFIHPFKNNNTDGLDFDITIYPVLDGKAYPDNGANYTGTYKNNETNVDADTYYVDMSYGAIAVVDEYAKEVEYDLGEGVSLFGKAIKNAKYWGVADTEPNEAQDEVMTKYDIDSIYTMSTIGLAGVCNYVKLNDADPSAYVYDGNLKYLGRANEKLAYADVYYLSSKQLDVEDEEEPADDTDPPEAPEDLGGDGYPDNVNDNPGTGK